MFEAIRFVISEHVSNRKLLLKMALVNMSKQTLRTSLGVFWVYLHDFLYFFVFCAFRILMSGAGEIDGMHSVVYLMSGLIPWFFIAEVLNQGASSIRTNKAIIQSIKFPITIIPTVEVTAIFLKRLPSFLFIFAVCIYYGYIGSFHPLLFIYFMLCMLILMYSLTLFTSAFIAVSTDLHQFYLMFMRVMLYTMPIVWGYKHIQQFPSIMTIVKANPMVYIFNGFRSAFVTGVLPTAKYTAYFWGCTIVLFCMGSFVQYKLRRYYADVI
ncbi:MAG: ABC transporter permease [Oscillospiraceae bacterium]|nr:ABC transporter permease [Oscillospiraceae bacterium]